MPNPPSVSKGSDGPVETTIAPSSKGGAKRVWLSRLVGVVG